MTTSDQLRIDWDENCLRRHLERCRFPRVEIDLVCLLNRTGERRDREGSHQLELTISKRNAAKEIRCSPNAVVKAAERLVERGLLAVLRFGPKPTYVLSLDRLAKVEPPPDPLDSTRLFEGDWSPVVTGGHSPRAPRERDIYISRVNRETRVPRGAQGGAGGKPVTTGDHPEAARSPQRGSAGGVRLADLSDDDVRQLNLPRLHAAHADAVSQGWLNPGREDARKFLAMCAHAATAPGIHTPARVVYAAVKNYWFDRASQRAWDWASQVLSRCPEWGGAEPECEPNERPTATLRRV